jgi:sulfonate transport system substrate-binding protein
MAVHHRASFARVISMTSRLFVRSIATVTGFLLGLVVAPVLACAAPMSSLGISYAYYDPLSLILKDKSYLQDELGPKVSINWVLSQGSNKALEFLRGSSIQFGQTAGSAALLGCANGAPVQVIATTAVSEWTAIVVRAGSPIKTIADLKGKRVAATPGTDPYIFLLRALATQGLTGRDITLVPLQHPLGRQALDAGQVDAWAGLDPFMAEAQLQNHDVLVYRNPALISPGTLLVRDEFEAAHPDVVREVLIAYAQARAWAIANPEGTAELLAKDSGLSIAVAKLQLTRVNFQGEAVGPTQRASILAAVPILKASGKLTTGADIGQAAASLVNTSFTTALGIH